MKVAVNAKKKHTQTLYACNSQSEHSVQTKPPTAVAPASAPASNKQGSHGRLRHEVGCSGARVEHSFLRKSCFFYRRGAYFQNITFPGPVEKGHRDVVNHMPLAHSDKALRSKRHGIMHDPNSVASSASAQRQLIWHADRGRAGPRRGALC